MFNSLHPGQVLLLALAGWINGHQQAAIDYLREENRVLREQRGAKRLRLTDDQRRRLAGKAKALGRKALDEVATIVLPRHCSPGIGRSLPGSGTTRRNGARPVGRR